MKPEAIRRYYVMNGKIKSTDDTEVFKDIIKPPIYEVIRVINKIPLFLEDHLERMFKSAELAGVHIHRSTDEIKEDIEKLIQINEIENLNVKLLYTNIKDDNPVLLVYLIKSFYPPENYYEEGIHTILFHYKRENPNIKIQKSTFKEEVANKLKNKKAFEALLVDENGYITEGSRSNMFFVRDNKIYTAPKGTVLLGITRKYILKVCKEENIEVVEKNINIDELSQLEGAFMSGTSVNVLPISSIEDIKLNSVNNSTIKRISKGYRNKVKAYIESKNFMDK